MKNEWLVTFSDLCKNVRNIILENNANIFQSTTEKDTLTLADKFRGSLIGLAIGDAFGTTLEFSSRNAHDSHTKMLGGGPFNLAPGQWTDDTSMALCLAYSLLNLGKFYPRDQLELYVKWWREGAFSSTGKCFDIGNTVADALSLFETNGDTNAGATHEHSAGNGSLMRLAPVVLFYAATPNKAIEYAAESSKTTHRNEQAVDACRYFSSLILGALLSKSKEEILSSMFCPIDRYWQSHPLCSQVEMVALGSFKKKTRDEIQSSGYVIHSLEAALWAFYHSKNFEDGLIKAVNLGDDADTIGAIYGQLAGAFYGEKSIPQELIITLSDYQLFFDIADTMLCRFNLRS